MIAALWTWNGWDALVAIGTLLLAGCTAALATYTARLAGQTRTAVAEGREQLALGRQELETLERQTETLKTQADATRRQAEISAGSLAATTRPLLVAAVSGRNLGTEEVPYTPGLVVTLARDAIHYHLPNAAWGVLSVPLQNVGPGVALVQGVYLIVRDVRHPGRVSRAVVPWGELTRARFQFTLLDQADRATVFNEITGEHRGGRAYWTLEIEYTGTSETKLVSRISVLQERPDASLYLVTAQELFEGAGEHRRVLASTQDVE